MADAALHMNLAEVRENIKANTEIKDVRKRDLLSGLNTLSKWLEIPLRKIPADRRGIRGKIAELNHSQLGVTKKRFQNVRTLVDQALDIGMMGVARESVSPITSEWSALVERVPDRWRQFKLLQLARYCSAQEITPPEINNDVFEVWLEWRKDNAPLAKKPERAVEDVVTTWNWSAKNIKDWPAPAVPKPSKRKSVILPLDAFPQSLRDELNDFYEQSTEETAALKSSKPHGKYRGLGRSTNERRVNKVGARTARNRVTAILMCATEIINSGEARVDELVSIGSIVNPESAGLMADAIVGRKGDVTQYPYSLVKSLRSVAAQWLNVEKEEIEAFNGLLEELAKDSEVGELTSKNRRRIAQFANVQNTVRLVSLPSATFAALEKERERRNGKVTIQMACQARSAAAVLILCMLPIRRANLCGIVVGKHLLLARTSKDQSRLTFEAHEVKNQRAVGCVVKPEKEQLLRLYLKHYRPHIYAGDDGAGPLLVTQSGKPISGEAISTDVRKFVARETGLQMNIHLFRHVMGAIILKDDPGQYDVVRSLLGHSEGSRTTELYAELQSAAAAEVLDGAIEKETSKPRRRKPVQREWRRDHV